MNFSFIDIKKQLNIVVNYSYKISSTNIVNKILISITVVIYFATHLIYNQVGEAAEMVE